MVLKGFIIILLSASVFSRIGVENGVVGIHVIANNHKINSVCAHLNTCRQAFAEEFNNLKIKKCMCDEDCSRYNDCCEDSQYYTPGLLQFEKKIACVKTHFNGSLYMVNKCPTNYPMNDAKNRETATFCHTVDQILLIRDHLLITPVTSVTKNITYRNAFCAICHNVTDYEFWQVLMHCEAENSINSSTMMNEADIHNILINLKVDETRSTLISNIEDTTYMCNFQATLQDSFVKAVRLCRPNTIDRQCSVCDQLQISSGNTIGCKNTTKLYYNLFPVDLKNKYLPKVDHCYHLEDADTNRDIFCAGDDDRSCFAQSRDSRLCLVNSFFIEGTDFYYVDNETVFLKRYNATFGKEEWTKDTSAALNHIYVCGTAIPQSQHKKFYSTMNDLLALILIKFSILFLALYLITSANKKYFSTLPNKILYSYSTTLLALYLVSEMAHWLPTCYVAAAILHYLFLCCFTWLGISSYDAWRVICCSSSKFQAMVGKTHVKRYLIYCILCWGLPLSIVTVAVYFELAPISKIPCSLKPGYGRLKQCFIAHSRPAKYFFYYPSNIVCCIVISLFLHTSYHIYMSKRKPIESTARNNNYVVFMKLALATGLTWTLSMLMAYIHLWFDVMYTICSTSQGILLFFAFCFKKNMITKCTNKKTETIELTHPQI